MQQLPCWFFCFFLALDSGNNNVRMMVGNGFDAVYGLELERLLIWSICRVFIHKYGLVRCNRCRWISSSSSSIRINETVKSSKCRLLLFSLSDGIDSVISTPFVWLLLSMRQSNQKWMSDEYCYWLVLWRVNVSVNRVLRGLFTALTWWEELINE